MSSVIAVVQCRTNVHDAPIRMMTQLITFIASQECGSIRRMDTNLAAPQFELEMQTLNDAIQSIDLSW
jgi:hypothetical protein